MYVDGGSTFCLITAKDVLHDVLPRAGTATGTREIKTNVTAHVDLVLIFSMRFRTF